MLDDIVNKYNNTVHIDHGQFDLKLKELIKNNRLLRLGDILFNSNDGNQAYLIFQPVRKYFKTDNNSAYISEWKSKGLSNEGIKPPKVGNNNLTPQINYYEHHLRVIFSGSCLQQSKIDYSNKKISFYIVYELRASSSSINDPTLQNCLFGTVTLTKNVDIDNCKYSGYGIGFDSKGSFSFPSGGFGQNVIIFGADMSSSPHIDNKGKDILVLGRGPTQGLGENSLTAEKMYSINFTVTKKKFCLSLHYNGANSYLFVNGKEIIKFKAKDSIVADHYV